MTPHDKQLIADAKRKRWEDINEDDAETEDGRKALHDIIMRKYHYDEYKADMI